jgi:hypothetical protein
MTATPTPTIIQKDPSYAGEVKRMFEDADFKTNKQLNLLAGELDRRDEHLLNELARSQLPTTGNLYNLLMGEHQARIQGGAKVDEMPDDVAFEGVKGFQDPNAKVKATLRTPVKPSVPESPTEEWIDESVSAAPKQRGRPKLSDEVKALRAIAKQEAKKQIQYQTIKNTRANQKAGLASPLASQKAEMKADELTPKISKYFKTTKQVQEEAEDQKKIDALETKLNRQKRREIRSAKKSKAREKVLDKTFANIFAQTSGDEI